MHCAAVLTQSPNLQGFYRVQNPHRLRSVWPLQASIHICLLLTMGITESGQKTPRRLPFTSKSGHTPPGWSSETAPRGVRHYLTSVDTGPTAYRDVHRSSWRMWRSAHMHIYEYINIYIYIFCFSYVNTCYGEKHSADTLRHRHPPPLTAITWLKKQTTEDGRADHPWAGSPSAGTVPITFWLALFFCYTGPSDFFCFILKTLSVQTNLRNQQRTGRRHRPAGQRRAPGRRRRGLLSRCGKVEFSGNDKLKSLSAFLISPLEEFLDSGGHHRSSPERPTQH